MSGRRQEKERFRQVMLMNCKWQRAQYYERMDRFTGMAIVSYAWDDGIRSVGKHIEPYILWKACKRGTVVWNIGLSDAALYKAEVQQLL